MSSWAAIVKKSSSNKFVKYKKKKPKNVDEEKNVYKLTAENFFYDPDEEFSYKYSDRLYNIQNSFKKHIKLHALPFLDNQKLFAKRNLYDYIMYNSENYEKMVNQINMKNNIILEKWDEDSSSDDSID